MDIPLSLPTGSRDPSHCLTLSYGIQFDTTFDEAASDLPCEVHMFDVMPFYPDIAEEEPHVHFHQIDIDGGEWDVLKNLAQDPILDAVGQVAMEVHVVNLVMSGTSWSTQSQVSRENWLRALQEKYQILRLFESRGFRRVVYWDNVQDKFALYEKDGTRHETAGELLYVNTNWYRDSFRTLLRTRGYNISTLNAR
ncbi:hypothetical protein Pmani_006811 [Petrolisthes manimaculis]|uniref:Methyltransferase domain-containing protein n=1 Tax=Petrolisthes manimaculis TaxID=1843537 RepID=A0AAE1Q9P1_9EUCA|nr:hypothetical protein Pmani_006811 [Petrolisthes manimaculis]